MDEYALLNELKTLRRGRGLQHPNVSTMIGPNLRELSKIDENDSNGVAREKIIKKLHEMIKRLPSHNQLSAEAALGLTNRFDQELYSDRISTLAVSLDRDVRTARRRVDDAFARLAEVATQSGNRPAYRSTSWQIDHFSAILRLDTPTPMCLEERKILALEDDVQNLVISISIPPRDNSDTDTRGANFEVMFGAILVEVVKATPSRFTYTLQLPRSLAAGETHDYGLITRLPEHQPMRPHYMYFPERPCADFDVRIRFAQDALPEQCWSRSDAFPRDADDAPPTTTVLRPDLVGEVQAHFSDLMPGLGYGVQWKF
ncbi:hypothetical protein JOF56_002157 [Kibdelosporangium banguiense]|uniref:Uncharacterized protein n=1 Tax=Kibdelosporangium banguiense TaxID=1365924 RepID=A0ABS4TBH0_9PSEU|nr:hypothetical protein [Kibdelosporangium banguiense]MBP2321772.1 hypothetical protein [Kibdelosporangium banguiense]